MRYFVYILIIAITLPFAVMALTPVTPTEISHTQDATWVAVDITSQVGSDAGNIAGAIIEIVNNEGVTNSWGARGTTQFITNTFNIAASSHVWAPVVVDENDWFELYLSDASEMDVYLVGYITKDEGFFYQAPKPLDVDNTSTWEEPTLAAGGTSTPIYELTGRDDPLIGYFIVENVGTAQTFGVRPSGSTDNRTASIAASVGIGVMIGFDSDAGVEANFSNTGMTLRFLGYSTDNITIFSNAKDHSTATVGSYTDTDLSADVPAGNTGAFFSFFDSTGIESGSIRKGGTSHDTYLDLASALTFGWTGITSTSSVDQKIESTSLDLFINGYSNTHASPSCSDYTYFREMTINSSEVATTTSNGYTILATSTINDLKATSSGGDIQHVFSTRGGLEQPADIVFCDSTGTTVYDMDVEYYSSTTGQIAAWIELDSISSTSDKTIRMYYGNTDDDFNPPIHNAWKQGFATSSDAGLNLDGTWHEAIYHLSEDPSLKDPQVFGVIREAEDNEFGDQGNAYGAMTNSDSVSGPAGNAIDFDGTDDVIVTGLDPILDTSEVFTFSVWFNSDVTVTGGATSTVFGARSPDGHGRVQMSIDSAVCGDGLFGVDLRDDGTSTSGDYLCSTTRIDDQSWHQAVFIEDGTNIRLYIDGALEDTTAQTSISNGYHDYLTVENFGYSIGAFGDLTDDSNSLYFNGQVDEVRMYVLAIDPADIITDFNMMNDNTAFVTFGDEQTVENGFGVLRGTMLLNGGTLIIR